MLVIICKDWIGLDNTSGLVFQLVGVSMALRSWTYIIGPVVEVAIGCRVNRRASAIIYKVLECMAIAD